MILSIYFGIKKPDNVDSDNSQILHAWKTSLESTWNYEKIHNGTATGSRFGNYSSAVVDSNGNIFYLAQEGPGFGNNNLWLFRTDGLGEYTPVGGYPLETGGDTYDWTYDIIPGQYGGGLVINDEDELFISCYSGTGTGEGQNLILYHYDTIREEWVGEVTDDDEDVGTDPAIGIDSNGYVHTIHHDKIRNRVKYNIVKNNFDYSYNNLYSFVSLDQGETWDQTGVLLGEMRDYNNIGNFVVSFNDYLFLAYHNEDNVETGDEPGIYDDNTYLLKLDYNFKIALDSNLVIQDITEQAIVSPDHLEYIDLILRIDADNNSPDDVVYMANTTNSKYDIIIENSSSTNGLNANDKSLFNEVKVSIDSSNSITNNLNKIHACTITGAIENSTTGGKNFNDCENDIFIGFLDGTATATTGDFNT